MRKYLYLSAVCVCMALALGEQKTVRDGQKALRCRLHRDKIGMNEKHGVTSQKFT